MRSILGRILLVVAGLVVPVLLVDLGFLLVKGPVRVVEDFYESVVGYGYKMRPGLDFVFASPYHGYRARVRTNDRGLRDDEFVVPKPPGVFRVLLVGDSMTAGLEVGKNETFEAVCENLLARYGPVEVINAGVRGYNLDNILGFLRLGGLAYEPDLVVYVFVDNDLMSSEVFRPQQTDASRGFTIRGVLGRLATYSHLTHRLEILRQMWALRRARDQTTGEPNATTRTVPGGLFALFTSPRFEGEALFLQTADRIAEMARLCDRAGAGFLLAGAPHREEIDPEVRAEWTAMLGSGIDFDGVRRYMAWVAKRNGLQSFDPVPAFRNAFEPKKGFWFHKDHHLNASGHRLFGTLLAQNIAARSEFLAWRTARDGP